MSYYRNLASYNDSDLISGLFDAAGAPLEQCKIPWPFPSGTSNVCSKPNNQVPVVFSNLSTTALFFGVMCRIVRPVLACGAGGAPLHAAQADLYSAKVTVSESLAPVVTNVAGSAWGGGLVSGTVPVTFAAQDASGIRELAVRADTGQTLVSAPQPCDFTVAPPCPQQPPGALNVDTTRVPDGPRRFTLVVTDAAGNEQLVSSPPVVVDNNGPPPPLALTATARGSGSNMIAVSWSNPPNSPAPITGAMAQLCQASCLAQTSIGAGGAAQLTAPGPGFYSVRLWLLDSAGRGGVHHAALASVTVPPAGLASRTKITAVLKGRQLRVGGPITVAGRVTVSWRSKVRGQTVGHGSRKVTIRNHRLRVTFAIPRRARVTAATVRVAVRKGRRVVGQARARRAR